MDPGGVAAVGPGLADCPPELLDRILRHPRNGPLQDLRLVCKEWRELVDGTISRVAPRPPQLDCAHFSSVVALDLGFCSAEESAEHLPSLLAQLPRLRELLGWRPSLPSWSRNEPEGRAWLMALGQLTALQMVAVERHGLLQVITARCRALQRLRLDRARLRRGELQDSLANVKATLTELDIRSSRVAPAADGSFSLRVLEAHPQLRTLRVHDLSLGERTSSTPWAAEDMHEDLAVLTQLTCLDVSNMLEMVAWQPHVESGADSDEEGPNAPPVVHDQYAGDECIAPLAQLTGLVSLGLAVRDTSDWGFRALSGLTGLRHLRLALVDRVDPEEPQHILPGLLAFTRLTSLELSGNSHRWSASDCDCLQQLRALRRLKTARLAGHPEALATATQLRHLELSEQYEIGNPQQPLGAEVLSGVTRLDFSTFSGLSTVALDSLAAMTGLQELSLRFNRCQDSISRLAGLSALQRLHLAPVVSNCSPPERAVLHRPWPARAAARPAA